MDVSEAGDGPGGLDLARVQRPDVILLDVMMPGLDGWRVAEMLLDDPVTADIPIVFLTARADVRDRARGHRPRRPRVHHEAVQPGRAGLARAPGARRRRAGRARAAAQRQGRAAARAVRGRLDARPSGSARRPSRRSRSRATAPRVQPVPTKRKLGRRSSARWRGLSSHIRTACAGVNHEQVPHARISPVPVARLAWWKESAPEQVPRPAVGAPVAAPSATRSCAQPVGGARVVDPSRRAAPPFESASRLGWAQRKRESRHETQEQREECPQRPGMRRRLPDHCRHPYGNR